MHLNTLRRLAARGDPVAGFGTAPLVLGLPGLRTQAAEIVIESIAPAISVDGLANAASFR